MPALNPETSTTRPTRAPRCRKPGHKKHVKGCTDCRAWSTYERRLRAWEAANGISRALVPLVVVQDHLKFLIDDGNLAIRDIAAESGISVATISNVLDGGRDGRRGVFQITADSLLAVKPREQIRPPKAGMVPPLEGVRILRGLHAQGWPWPCVSDLLGGSTRTQAQKLAYFNADWMKGATLDRIRAVARELGPYDIRMGVYKPGMDMRAANNADRRGWVALWRWEGRDLADPDAEPIPAETRDGEPATGPDDRANSYAFVDSVLTRRINRAVETVLATSEDGGRGAVGYIESLGRLTRLEVHIAWWIGESAGLNDTQIGQLLGYPASTNQERDTAQRQMNRLRLKVLAAREWVEQHPHGQTPAWFTRPSVARKRDFGEVLAPLVAILPEPLGYGWTVTQLAENCGLTEDQARAFLDEASRVANGMWEPRVCRRARRRRRPARCHLPASVRAA